MGEAELKVYFDLENFEIHAEFFHNMLFFVNSLKSLHIIAKWIPKIKC